MNNFIQTQQLTKAVKALRAYLNGEVAPQSTASKSKKKQLVEADEFFEVHINLLKVPSTQKRLIPVRVPHSIFKRTGIKICLLTKDPQDEWEKTLESTSIANVIKTIAVKKLFSDFKPYEHRRVLAKQYDLFLADTAIIPLLPNALGNAFFKNQKEPIPVNLSKSFKKNIETARDSIYFSIPKGVTVSSKFAHSSFTDEQVIANLKSALPQIVERLPRKWQGILSIYVKTTTSASLPVFVRVHALQDFQDENKKTPKDKKKKSISEEEEEEEEEEIPAPSKSSKAAAVVAPAKSSKVAAIVAPAKSSKITAVVASKVAAVAQKAGQKRKQLADASPDEDAVAPRRRVSRK